MALVAHLSRAGALACRPSMAKRCRVLIPVRAFKDSPKQDAPQQQHQKSNLPATQQQQESRVAARPERPLEVMPFRRMTEALQQMQNEMDAIMDHFGFDDLGFGRRSPFALLAPFANAMPRIAGPITRLVPFDVKEEKDNYKVTVEVPGFTKKDIKVMLDPSTNTLTITGQKTETEGKEAEQASSRVFSFTRSFSLPQDVDTNKGIKARTEHGLLTVELPKSPESTPQMKEILVEGR